MLKRLFSRYWQMALLIALIGAVLYMSRYAENRKAQEGDDAQGSSPRAAVGPPDGNKGAQNADKPHHHPDWIDTFAWPEGATTWALLLTLIVIGWQSTETRVAARGSEKSAEAALRTVQIMADSERPWIVAHMEQANRSCLLDNGNVRFTWTVKNVGKSPAKLIESGAMVSLDTIGPSVDQIHYKMESLDERILVPGDSAQFFAFWSIIENGRIRTQVGKTLEEFNDLVMFYGRIRYRGAIDPSDIYETRFSETSSITGGVCDGFEPSWPVAPEDIHCT
jgi:hypothetical protein